MVLERQAVDLRIGLEVLRQELACATRENQRRRAELDALDSPARQRARLAACAALLGTALMAVALFLSGVLK